MFKNLPNFAVLAFCQCHLQPDIAGSFAISGGFNRHLNRFITYALNRYALGELLQGSGFLRRTMTRHIRLKGENNPHILIDRIEADLAAGRANAALSKFDQLPDSLQSLARGWRADMESALP